MPMSIRASGWPSDGHHRAPLVCRPATLVLVARHGVATPRGRAAAHRARALDTDRHHLGDRHHGALRAPAGAVFADRPDPARQAAAAGLDDGRQGQVLPGHRRLRPRHPEPPDLRRPGQPARGAAGADRGRRRRPGHRHRRGLCRRRGRQRPDAPGRRRLHLPGHPVRAAARRHHGPGPGHAGDRHQPAPVGELRARHPRRGAGAAAARLRGARQGPRLLVAAHHG